MRVAVYKEQRNIDFSKNFDNVQVSKTSKRKINLIQRQPPEVLYKKVFLKILQFKEDITVK